MFTCLHTFFKNCSILKGSVHSKSKCFSSATKINITVCISLVELWQILIKLCSTNKHWVRGISFSSSVKGISTVITGYLIIGSLEFKLQTILSGCNYQHYYNINTTQQNYVCNLKGLSKSINLMFLTCNYAFN